MSRPWEGFLAKVRAIQSMQRDLDIAVSSTESLRAMNGEDLWRLYHSLRRRSEEIRHQTPPLFKAAGGAA